MKTFLNRLLSDEQAQDLIEYVLLLAFVALASAALFVGSGDSVKGIWTTGNEILSKANPDTSTPTTPLDPHNDDHHDKRD